MSDVRNRVRSALFPWLRMIHSGRARECPICGSRLRRFHTYGVPPRKEALCPVCGSLERHRLLWIFLKGSTGLFDPGRRRLLHVSPQPILASILRRLKQLDYCAADLTDPRAMIPRRSRTLPYSTRCSAWRRSAIAIMSGSTDRTFGTGWRRRDSRWRWCRRWTSWARRSASVTGSPRMSRSTAAGSRTGLVAPGETAWSRPAGIVQ